MIRGASGRYGPVIYSDPLWAGTSKTEPEMTVRLMAPG